MDQLEKLEDVLKLIGAVAIRAVVAGAPLEGLVGEISSTLLKFLDSECERTGQSRADLAAAAIGVSGWHCLEVAEHAAAKGE